MFKISGSSGLSSAAIPEERQSEYFRFRSGGGMISGFINDSTLIGDLTDLTDLTVGVGDDGMPSKRSDIGCEGIGSV